MPTINTDLSWPQQSTTYVGLKGQVGLVVTHVFINHAYMSSKQETENRVINVNMCTMYTCVYILYST